MIYKLSGDELDRLSNEELNKLIDEDRAFIDGLISKYRNVMIELESQTTPEGKAEFEAIAERLRKQFAEVYEEDELDELAHIDWER